METLRVHYCLDKPRDDRRCRARCGHWVAAPHYTDDHALVTCKACRKLLALPPQSKSTAMTKLSSILPLALILLAACGPLPADDLDGSTSSGASTSGESTGSTGAESTGEGSTSEAMDLASTGEGSTGDASGSGGMGGEGSSTGEPEDWGMCLGQGCAFSACRDGLSCLPHPGTGEPVCVSLCGAVGDACGSSCIVGTQLECMVGDLGVGYCFPV